MNGKELVSHYLDKKECEAGVTECDQIPAIVFVMSVLIGAAMEASGDISNANNTVKKCSCRMLRRQQIGGKEKKRRRNYLGVHSKHIIFIAPWRKFRFQELILTRAPQPHIRQVLLSHSHHWHSVLFLTL